MDGPEFRHRGREMVDYIVDYMENIRERRVTPNIEPGYLQELIPKEPPQKPEEWEDVMKDVEEKIMVGVSDRKITHSTPTNRYEHKSKGLIISKNFEIFIKMSNS